MGLIQIEDSELAVLRKERDDARAEAATFKAERDTAMTEKAEAATAAEAAEAAKVAAETAKAAAETKVTQLEEGANQITLKDTRMSALGDGFTAKLGDFTKGRLGDQAKTMDDTAWDERLKELEEITAVKRDAAKDGSPPPPDNGNNGNNGSRDFTLEEIASTGGSLNGGQQPTLIDSTERASVVGSLAGLFKKTA